ncbi:MAG: NAD(P)-binding domain-containing protein, partial [Myxococcota bacterium]
MSAPEARVAATPTVLMIGAGPVATALAGALRRSGIAVVGLWARRPAAARAAAAIAGVLPLSPALPDDLGRVDVIVVAVRDGAITEVAQRLVATGRIGRGQVMLHCSGAVSANAALGAVAEHLAGVGTLHPLSAIADGRAAMAELRGATVF